MPKIWVYCICYNEALMMTYFLRHYSTFAEKIVIYDQGSNDGTREIVSACDKAELRDYPLTAELNDMAFAEFSRVTYKEARGLADWVIWVDADEFIYHPRLTEKLSEYLAAGVDCPLVDGWSMLADAPPSGNGQIYHEITKGLPDSAYSKPAVIRPEVDIAWGAGKHALMSGDVKRSATAEIKLLHFRNLGADWLLARDARNFARMSDENKARGLGWQVHPEPSATNAKLFQGYLERAVEAL